MDGRSLEIGRAVAALVAWARLLDSRKLFPFGELRLTRPQAEVLFLVAHSTAPVTPGALAQELRVTRGAVTQLVAGLITAGLVERSHDPADARRRVLRLSAAARARVDQLERDVVDQLVPRFAALDDEELATLARLLVRTAGVA